MLLAVLLGTWVWSVSPDEWSAGPGELQVSIDSVVVFAQDIVLGEETPVDVVSPEEILAHQANRLDARTNGLLVGHVVKHIANDRVTLGFEVEATRVDSRIRLFEVQHRLEFEYPAAIIPPDDSLPEFLKDQVYRSGLGDRLPSMTGKWVENQWVTSSPSEFTKKVETLLARPTAKAVVLSLLSRSTREASNDVE